MAENRTLTVTYLDADNKTSTAKFKNINTSLGSEILLSFTKGIFHLTDNTYVSTTQDDTTKLD